MVQDASSTSSRTHAAAAAGRSMPHSVEAEEYLLSCCLLDGADVISRCLEARIKPESFYDPKHGTIYECLLELYNRQKPIDVSVVAEELKTSRQLDQIGGYAFLAQVSARIPTTAQAGYFIEKVREQALLRELDTRRPRVDAAAARADYREALTEIAGLRPAVDRFFTEVFVMADDARLRTARLALMAQLRDLILSLADISEIVSQTE